MNLLCKVVILFSLQLILFTQKSTSNDPATEAALTAARKVTTQFEKSAELMCKSAKFNLPPGVSNSLKVKSGKVCKATWDEHHLKGVDAACLPYPAYCSKMKMPKETQKAFTSLPCWVVNPCVLSKFVEMRKVADSTPLKCMFDISLAWYTT